MRARGFTLLELMLALTLGALVVAGCVAVMGMVQRSERAVAVRFEQSSDLATLHRVMSNTFDTLVMAQPPGPPRRGDEAASQEDTPPPEIEEEPLPAGWTLPGVRPRLILTPDPRFGESRFGFTGGSMADRSPWPRLEVLLARPPLPGLARGPDESDEREPRRYRFGTITGLESEDDPVATLAEREPPVRCVFEVWPDEEPGPSGDVTYTLWYRPTTKAGDPYDAPLPGARPDESRGAYPLVEGVQRLRYRVFADAWESDYRATIQTEIPAYAECEIETSGGLYGNWLFELGWTVRQESAPDDPSADEPENEDDEDREEESAEGDEPGIDLDLPAGVGDER